MLADIPTWQTLNSNSTPLQGTGRYCVMEFLFYRRPDFVAKVPRPLTKHDCELYVERTQKHKRRIPSALSFENIIQNRALPPASLEDFMVRSSSTLAVLILTLHIGVLAPCFSRCREPGFLLVGTKLHSPFPRASINGPEPFTLLELNTAPPYEGCSRTKWQISAKTSGYGWAFFWL